MKNPNILLPRNRCHMYRFHCQCQNFMLPTNACHQELVHPTVSRLPPIPHSPPTHCNCSFHWEFQPAEKYKKISDNHFCLKPLVNTLVIPMVLIEQARRQLQSTPLVTQTSFGSDAYLKWNGMKTNSFILCTGRLGVCNETSAARYEVWTNVRIIWQHSKILLWANLCRTIWDYTKWMDLGWKPLEPVQAQVYEQVIQWVSSLKTSF